MYECTVFGTVQSNQMQTVFFHAPFDPQTYRSENCLTRASAQHLLANTIAAAVTADTIRTLATRFSRCNFLRLICLLAHIQVNTHTKCMDCFGVNILVAIAIQMYCNFIVRYLCLIIIIVTVATDH